MQTFVKQTFDSINMNISRRSLSQSLSDMCLGCILACCTSGTATWSRLYPAAQSILVLSRVA